MGEQDTSSLVSVFEDFFTNIYKEKINDVLSSYPSTRSVEVDFEDIDKFDTTVADHLIHEPEVVVDAAEEAIRNLNLTLPPGVGEFAPHVRFFNGPRGEIMIERLSSGRLNELVTFKGIVTKRTDVMHKVKLAHYSCQACGETYSVQVTRNFKPPRMCASCKKLALVPNEEKSKFADVQKAEAQDLLEKVTGGSPAAKIELWFEDDMVNRITPGENVEVTGILRIKPAQSMKQKNELVFNRYVEIIHIQSLKRDFEEIHLTKEDISQIKELSKHPEIIKRVFDSIAPAVYGYNEVKKALALQLFGGTKGKLMKGRAAVRDDIHVLLIGDPGIAKCADGDSEVLLSDGSLCKLRDTVEEVFSEKGKTRVEDGFYATSNHDLVSLGLDATLSPSKATHFWKLEAPERMYEVETASGKKVIVTPEHPFFISEAGHIAPKPASEVREGEFISTPRRIPITGAPQPLPRHMKGKTSANKISRPSTLDADFARLLGYLAGDGYFRRTSSYEISLTNNDEELLSDFNSILASLGLETKVKTDKRTGAKTSFAFSVELGSVLSALGIGGKTARTKTIPQAILRSPNKVASEFIKAYFDCDATVGNEGVAVVSASRSLLSRIQLLLLRFGIISQLHKTVSRASNTVAKRKRAYYRLFILGENAKKYAKHIGFNCRAKSRRLSAIASRQDEDFNTNTDVIPNLGGVLRETRASLGLTQAQCGVPRPTYAHFEQGNRNPSRRTLRKIVSAFIKAGGGDSNPVRLLASLANSHVFWDRVSRIRRIKPREKWVYDLQVDPTHNFIANGMVVHNTRFLNSTSALAPKSMYVSGKSVSGVGLTASAEKDELGDGGWTLKAGALVLASGGIGAIDEFDKIDEEDRASLHEVMESQSYHYNTRLMFSDGREVPIGQLVEERMERNNESIMRGHDCLILREGIGDISILTTDFGKISPTSPFQVSKHKAPDYFIKVTLQNGRELMVTPEHPFWVMNEGDISTKEAAKLTAKDYTLAPRTLPIEGGSRHEGENFFKFLGYHITDGGYELNRGSKNGVNFYNKDPMLIEDYRDSSVSVFGVRPHSCANPSTGVMAERTVSMPVLRKLESIYSPLIGGGKEKHVPPGMLCAPKRHVSMLLRAAFDGDGTFTGGHAILVSENNEFALQVQLLLLRFGIRSRIYPDGKVWRVSIGGRGNLEKYAREIGFLSGKKMGRLNSYLKRPAAYRNTTDVVPNCAGKVSSLLKSLKIYEKEALEHGLDVQKRRNYSFTIRSFRQICSTMRAKIGKIRKSLQTVQTLGMDGLIGLRKELNLSQYDLEKHGSVKRATVSYWETRKIFPDRYRMLLVNSMEKMLEAEQDVSRIERIAFGDVGFVSISRVEKIPNDGQEWVYDVTVKPTQAFISECAVLHNTVSIAKAGIVAKFKAKTAIVAAANPKHGRFNQTKNLADQFDVPPSLLSRFDLIFPILDVLDEEKDLNLAEHILTSHIEAARGTFVEEAEILDRDLLRKYIAYARRYVHPVLGDSAKDKIKEFYLDLRRRGKSSGSVPITPRYLEGLVRLSEAHAKMRLSNSVELEDAVVAVELMDHVLRKVMTDQETGRFDVDIITTGRSRSQVEKVEAILDIIKEKTRDQEAVPRQEVLDEAESSGMDKAVAKRILGELMHKGEVYEKEPGWLALVGNR